MQISHIDHFVLTVKNVEETLFFYQCVLGMQKVSFEDANGISRNSLVFGSQKINLHQAGKEFEPKAKAPTSGSADFCLITKTPMQDIISHMQTQNVKIEEGPIARTGAVGAINSIYIRDLDQNLIEISNYET
ncbi:MAG: VOC family protein [Nitratireductor sp.]